MKAMVQKDQKGVSPVIAVILMVAITVVLSGVLYVWVSSLTEGTKEKAIPILPLDVHDAKLCDPDEAAFYLIHSGGEQIDLDDYVIQVERVDQPGSTVTLSFETHISNESCTSNSWNPQNHIIKVQERVYFYLPDSFGTIPDNLRVLVVIIDKETDRLALSKEVKIFYVS